MLHKFDYQQLLLMNFFLLPLLLLARDLFGYFFVKLFHYIKGVI